MMEKVHANLRQSTVDMSSHALAPTMASNQSRAQERPLVTSTSENDDSPLRGLSLSSAQATLNSGRTLVTNYIMAANNTLAEIRVIDPTTHQVVAASPPDTIAQMRQEMLAYQSLGKDAGTWPGNAPTVSATPPESAKPAE